MRADCLMFVLGLLQIVLAGFMFFYANVQLSEGITVVSAAVAAVFCVIAVFNTVVGAKILNIIK